MDMGRASVAIIGGGLAGLLAARRLHMLDIDAIVIEARERLGGRILSADQTGAPCDDGFDLGPSWFWPHVQPEMAALARDLGLAAFPQHDDGDMVFERMSRETAWRYRATGHAPQSMRLVGGTGALIAALARDLPADRVWTGARVTRVTLGDDCVSMSVAAADGSERLVVASEVIAALPPRLLDAVAFSPAIEPATRKHWQDTPTWMAPHAKFFAVYDRPFWRDAGLAGTAQSFVGPMGEIHDATTASGKAALFGFLSVGADVRAAIGEPAIRQACLTQLGRLFGPQALQPRATILKDWADDPLTSTAHDRTAGGHPRPTNMPWVDRTWQGRLSLCGSETSAVEPGYMEGAISAAYRAVREVIVRLGTLESRTSP